MRRLGTACVITAFAGFVSPGTALALATQQSSPAAAPREERYAEGQVWEYRTRPADAGSLIKIQNIEAWPGAPERGPIYHITIVGLRVNSGTAVTNLIQHAPVSRQSLDASVTRLSASWQEFPSADAGIKEWREAKGGVFTISVAQIVEMHEQTMRKGVQGQAQ